jgi:hypothetical protein
MNVQNPSVREWRKASACPSGATCVEIAVTTGGGAAMRDSKDPQSPELHFDGAGWSAFLNQARAGAFGRTVGSD